MADFKAAIGYVLDNEGGYVNDPNDPGGETNFGISKRSYPNVDIRNLTRDGATAIYLRDFWKFDGLNDQRLATKLFDEYVNQGTHAIRALQQSLGYIQAGPIVADGNYGPATERAANAADSVRLLNEFEARLAYAHALDAIANPAQKADLLGWFRRDVKEPR